MILCFQFFLYVRLTLKLGEKTHTLDIQFYLWFHSKAFWPIPFYDKIWISCVKLISFFELLYPFTFSCQWWDTFYLYNDIFSSHILDVFINSPIQQMLLSTYCIRYCLGLNTRKIELHPQFSLVLPGFRMIWLVSWKVVSKTWLHGSL